VVVASPRAFVLKTKRGTTVDDVLHPRVFQAVNTQDHRVAACKVVALTPKTTQADRKSLDKEMRVHAALKHANVLEFLTAVVVEPGTESPYVPAIYMLLEFAAGGDLFDKIGALAFCLGSARHWLAKLPKLLTWELAKK
jgi:serine/threonine protein kinase